MRLRIFACFITASCLGSAALASTSPVGAIPGQFFVSETGAATYTIPIAVPSGIAGMEPKLSLSYNSQGGNGLLGVGWSLSGLSAITRCPRTIVQDGANAGISYSNSDRYCLDGQRLVATTGTYGAEGTEYRTELESFTRIISYDSAGNGPAWFKIWTKSGQIVEYGNTADARIEAQGKTTVAVWAVNSISDTKGNYLTVTYTEDNPNGQYYPARIDYTGNANTAQAPTNSIQFTYETRPDANPQYVGESLVNLTKRMTTLHTYSAGTLRQKYGLTYENSAAPNNPSRLTQIENCLEGGACLPSSTFAWQGATGGVGFSAGTWSPPYLEYFVYNPNVFGLSDFNGDGKQDIYFSVYGGFSSAVKVAYSTGSGFGSPIVAGSVGSISCGESYCPAPIAVGDINGDGRADVLGWDGTKLLSTGAGFSAGTWSPPYLGYFVNNPNVFGLSDFNGDGKQDIYFSVYGGFPSAVKIAYSTGSGFGSPIVAGGVGSISCGESYCHAPMAVGDINGDGRADVLGWDGTKLLSTGTGFSAGTWSPSYLGYFVNNPNVFGLSDFNGDGKQDIYFSVYGGFSSAVKIAYSTGSGFGSPIVAGGVGSISCGESYCHAPIAVGDINGDGRADILGFDGTKYTATAPTPDLLTTITTGLGTRTQIAYTPISNASVYTPEAGSVYPYRDLLTTVPLYVVSSLSTDNGIYGQSEVSYGYAGAKTHLTGRGFLGFHTVAARDEQTGITTRTDYRQEYPHIGLPSRVTKTTGLGGPLYQQETTYAAQALGGSRYFPYAAESVESRYDLNGTLMASTFTTNQYDAYGNATRISVVSNDGHGKVTANQYDNDVTNWILGRLKRATVTSTTP